MALSQDQKKYLVLGTVGGAFAIFLGSMIFGGRQAGSAPMLGPPGTQPMPALGRHNKQRTKHRHDDDGDQGRDHDNDQNNGRGEYGRKKHHHKGHKHGD